MQEGWMIKKRGGTQTPPNPLCNVATARDLKEC